MMIHNEGERLETINSKMDDIIVNPPMSISTTMFTNMLHKIKVMCDTINTLIDIENERRKEEETMLKNPTLKEMYNNLNYMKNILEDKNG